MQVPVHECSEAAAPIAKGVPEWDGPDPEPEIVPLLPDPDAGEAPLVPVGPARPSVVVPVTVIVGIIVAETVGEKVAQEALFEAKDTQ